MHVWSICASYLAFYAASIAAILYLVQDNAIKNKRTGIIFSRLPDLSLLDKLIYRSVGLGFPLLTISIICGAIWTKHLYGTYWWGYGPRQFSSMLLWVIYAVMLHVRLSEKMRGRNIAFLSVLALLVIVVSLLGTCP